jgi:hypothetical protein
MFCIGKYFRSPIDNVILCKVYKSVLNILTGLVCFIYFSRTMNFKFCFCMLVLFILLVSEVREETQEYNC